MPSLPIISGQEVIRTFEKLGWKVVRQRGSHVILVKEGYLATLSVPNHKEVARGTLRSLIRSAGISENEFIETIGK